MKKFLSAIAALFIAALSFAQSGSATLTLHLGAERNFVFPNALPTLTTATEIKSGNDRYTNVDFSNLFEEEHEYVMVHLRFRPSGKGSFVIPPLNTQPANVVQIEVVYQKQTADGDIQKEINLVDNDAVDGASGSAMIAQYGAVGTDVMGSFEATLRELKENGSKGELFKVSGTFKIKLGKE